MTQLLSELHLTGLAIGICTFLIIGIFHPITIKAEYYWGARCWWVFLIIGVLGIGASIAVADVFWSSLLGVLAFTSLWTIKELFEQRRRVEKGWFPANPKRSKK